MADRIQFRRDTAARWSSINPILMEGEIGLETDTNHIKIGNGSSAWNNLEYGIGVVNLVDKEGDSSSLGISQKGANILQGKNYNIYSEQRGFNKLTFASQGSKVIVNWENDNDSDNYKYAYLRFENWNSYVTPIDEYGGVWCWKVKNTCDNDVVIGAALSSAWDWSKSYYCALKGIELKAGETKLIYLSAIDTNYTKGDFIVVHLVLYGNLGAKINVGDKTSLEVEGWGFNKTELSLANFATKAELAEHSKKGGIKPLNTYYVSVQETNYYGPMHEGSVTLTSIDRDTLKMVVEDTTKTETGGTGFTGTYWRVEYDNFEDLKDKIFTFKHKYQGYNQFHISKTNHIDNWGTQVDTINIVKYMIQGKTSWNLYDVIMSEKETYEAAGRWSGALITQGYFYVSILDYEWTGVHEGFEDEIMFYMQDTSAVCVATDFNQEVEDRIKQLITPTTESKIQVTNWGDSLTAGYNGGVHDNQEVVINAIKEKGYSDLSLTATSYIDYSIMMQALLGSNYQVNRCGVGGESLYTIAARLGANVAFPTQDFVLPKDTTAVEITSSGGLNSAWGDGKVTPLLQGEGISVNPCYIQGIECTLGWTGSKYTLKRNAAGDRAVSLSKDTPIIMYGSKAYRNTEIAVLWCWTNGGYDDNDDLVSKLTKMVVHLNTTKYVIIGVHMGTKESRQDQEKALIKAFGDKFFNWREYLSTNAMYDFGLTPTSEDITEMAKGSAPKTLLIDTVHMGAAGYSILGYKIVERFKDLGYIE